MGSPRVAVDRRERAKRDKRRRILAAAGGLLVERDLDGVTMQEVADRARVAVGTLFLYAGTKAELLIMVQNRKFADAIDNGLAAAASAQQGGGGAAETTLALIRPVVACLREQPRNGRAYLNELVFGDPAEPHRARGLGLAFRLEDELAGILARDPGIGQPLAPTLARVAAAIVHAAVTSAVHLHDGAPTILEQVHRHISAVIGGSPGSSR